MSRKCAACAHPDRSAIDANLAEGGRSIRSLSQTFVLSEHSLSRHKANHLPKIAIEAVTESREFGHRRKLKILEHTLFLALKRRLRDEDDGMVLKVHASLLRHYEFELKLGELEEIKAEIAALTEMVREKEETR